MSKDKNDRYLEITHDNEYERGITYWDYDAKLGKFIYPTVLYTEPGEQLSFDWGGGIK